MNNGPPQEQIIMIDLDVLLDTRFGTLAHLYPDKMATLLEKGYRERYHDEFNLIDPSIDMDKFRGIYDNRDKSVLAISRLSSFMIPLIEIIKEYEWEMTYELDATRNVQLIVNLFPYELTDDEVHQFLDGLRTRLGLMIDIKFTRKDPKQLNIVTLKYEGYTQYIMYHFNEWVRYHYQSEEKIRASQGRPDFIVVAPKLYSDYATLQSDEEARSVIQTLAQGNGEEAGFELTTIAMAPHFNLVYMDTVVFSLIDLANPVKPVPEEPSHHTGDYSI